MKVKDFISILNVDFFTGVPDSLLKPLCNYLMCEYGNDGKHHIIAANEGNAVGIASGYYLSTSKIPLVYMQNSGQGNMINPYASLTQEKVYGIPQIFVIGWRGEPGKKDEPQHVFQGEITLSLLDVLEIPYFIITKESKYNDIKEAMDKFNKYLSIGRSIAFVVSKGALSYDGVVNYENPYKFNRENILEHIVNIVQDDIIVSTTGKTSRELFEIRERLGSSHKHDFLTVGSMGHSSSIALGIAQQKPNKRVWCIDGDGAAIMHMGAMGVIGQAKPSNLVHIVINNEAHESVGGFPTAGQNINLVNVAKACGYKNTAIISTDEKIEEDLKHIISRGGLTFVEIKSAIGSRSDLGRPTSTPQENKEIFMKFLTE